MALLAASAAPSAAQELEFPASWTRPAAPFQIAEGLHYVGSEGLPAYLLQDLVFMLKAGYVAMRD